jgi:hypothetical protein
MSGKKLNPLFKWHDVTSDGNYDYTYVAEIRLGCFLLCQCLVGQSFSQTMQFVHGAKLEDFGVERDK